MTRLLQSQRGAALILTLAFLALSVPLITGALGLASTVSIDSRVKTGIAKSQYSTIGASQHALYRVVYETGYLDSLEAGVEDVYTIMLNGEEITVSIVKITDPPNDPPPPSADSSRRLQTLKEVIPTTASPDTLTTFTYTITVENRDDESENLRKIHDGLPVGFSYVSGSSAGMTINDPSISIQQDGDGNDYQQLTWNLTTLQLTLGPGESVNLSFDAQASPPTGNYCNNAWADPGGEKTSTGPTAKIVVGSPLNNQCPGEVLTLTKAVVPDVAPGNTLTTFTYTISLDNAGTVDLAIEQIRDLLPQDFTYIVGSTTGEITAAEPTVTLFQGRERLDWNFNPAYSLAAGATATLSFDAEASPEPGDYWNEVWVAVDEFENPAYTWPTALVRIMGVVRSTATAPSGEGSQEIWVGSDSYVVAQWNLTR